MEGVCFMQNAITLEIIVGIASYLEHKRSLGAGPFNFSYLDLGVTSRHLSMT